MTAAVVAGNAAVLDLRVYRFCAAPAMANPGSVTASTYGAIVWVQWVWLGIRRADRTPAGWGIGLLTAAAAVSLLPVVRDGILHHLGIVVVTDSAWLSTVLVTVCAVLLVAGLAVSPLTIHAQTHRKLLQFKPIREHLVSVFRSLDAPMAPVARRAIMCVGDTLGARWAQHSSAVSAMTAGGESAWGVAGRWP